jgi:hypothetical protein
MKTITPTRRAADRIDKLVNEKYDGNIALASKEIGCLYFQLYRLLRQYRAPSPDLLLKCATHFGVTLDELMAPQEIK